jgi:formylglycine-generating enzyme required for sulfatase activity
MRCVLAALLSGGAVAVSLASQAPATVTNSIGMEFVLIRPGSMQLGVFRPPYPKPVDPNAPSAARGDSPALTPDEYARIERMAKADYRDGFPVTISREFYIGRYEVTQAQWTRVMGTNPSIFQGDDASRHPVENVTWDDAQKFIGRLNALEKTTAYRLPTEFEWEYAARAGEDADTPWPIVRERAIAGYNHYFTTHTVGEKKPNAWGLYDMQGNVWEWVQDFYNEKLFADPTPPAIGKEHVLKGGGFLADVKNAIPATHAAGPGSKFDVGFRIVRDVSTSR